jgi:hypothetical protein
MKVMNAGNMLMMVLVLNTWWATLERHALLSFDNTHIHAQKTHASIGKQAYCNQCDDVIASRRRSRRTFSCIASMSSCPPCSSTFSFDNTHRQTHTETLH